MKDNTPRVARPLIPSSANIASQAAAFKKSAEALADWSFARIIVRRDVFGKTAADGKRFTGHDELTRELLVKHYRGLACIGAHLISPDGLCKCFIADVDAHDDSADPDVNWQCVNLIVDTLGTCGLVPIVCDSNGKDGYHVRQHFKKPVKAEVAYWLGQVIQDRLETAGLLKVELNPKQADVTIQTPYGNWVRLPGRHHKRDHWTRVYNLQIGYWMEGPAAVKAILGVAGDEVTELLAAFKAAQPKPKPKPKGQSGAAGKHQADEEEVRSALFHCPNNNLDFDPWIARGFALNDWDPERGLDLWIEWSKQSTKHVDGECERRWASMAPGGGITAKSIFGAAVDAGWKWQTSAAAVVNAEPSSNGKHQASDKTLVFSNFRTVMVTGASGNQEEVKASARMTEIADQLKKPAAGWPKRVEETLFIPTRDNQPVYLGSTQRLFAWLDSLAKVDWTKGSKFITQERFFEHLRMNVEQFEAIETLPHWPPIPGIYYLHQPVPVPAVMLERLLDFFHPSTRFDRELIKAMILTLFWGGSPGSRPAFLVTGPDQDPEQGRGVGKSHLCQILAEELAGGFVDVAPTDTIADVKTRLLSTESGRRRVVRLDNVKTHKFSWADLEGLITSSEISGRALYVGEGRRPNILVWMITLNGASLSKDMAQRCIQIKLDHPQFNPSWETEVREFIRSNRWGLIADIRALLEADSKLSKVETRWAAWERDVIGKMDGWNTLQTEIRLRQEDIDDDDDERTHVGEFFAAQLKLRSHDPDLETVFIPSVTAAEWVSDATRTKYPTNRASAFLSGLSIAELRKSDRGSQRRMGLDRQEGWTARRQETRGSTVLGNKTQSGTSCGVLDDSGDDTGDGQKPAIVTR